MDEKALALQPLMIVADGLIDLAEEVVFVGGAVAALYLDSKGAEQPRPTDDVDCVIEIASAAKFAELENQLRAIGFLDDSSAGAPIGRKIYHGLKVDLMPSSGNVLGFSNRWYPEGIQQKIRVTLPNGKEIFILSLPYYLATKLEAFKSRGQTDVQLSSDLEDIVLVLDGNLRPDELIRSAPQTVRTYLAEEFRILGSRRDFRELIGGFLSREGAGRIDRIEEIFKRVEKA